MIPSRSRYGRRMMLLIRSSGIVDAVCSTGIVAPGFSRSASVPGRQSTKYSPISDCGRVSQNASVRSEPKPVLSIAMSTSARLVLAVDAHAGDAAGAHAGDLDVGAVDDAERVVELDRVVGAPLGVLRAGRRAGDDRRDAGAEHEDDDEEAAHSTSPAGPGSGRS